MTIKEIAKQYAKDTLLAPEEIVYQIPNGMASICPHLVVADAFVEGFNYAVENAHEWHDIAKKLPEQNTHVLTFSEDGICIGTLVDEFFYDLDCRSIYPSHWMNLPKAPNEAA